MILDPVTFSRKIADLCKHDASKTHDPALLDALLWIQSPYSAIHNKHYNEYFFLYLWSISTLWYLILLLLLKK